MFRWLWIIPDIQEPTQPSYKIMRQRHEVLKELKLRDYKLKKTFITSPEYGALGYRNLTRNTGTKNAFP
jgi:hypothetical protein